jgi:type I restriction enzyme S subunit
VAEKVTEKNSGLAYQQALTNSATHGIVRQSEYFDRIVAGKNHLDAYYVVNPNDYVYNPRISKEAPCGPINRNTLELTGIASPLYLVFRVSSQSLAYEFLDQYFKTANWFNYMKLQGNSGARSDRFTIADTDFFSMPVRIPSLPEQRRIGDFFSTLDNLIAAAERQEALLRQKKQAYLQLMFPQDGETEPRLRFAGFSGEWERRQLGDAISAAGIKNKERQNFQSYSISNQSGFVPQSEQFDNGGKPLDADKSSYWIVAPRSFAYNPARINVGSIGYWDGEEPVIVSSLYEVFQTHESVDDSFLLNWFQTCLFTNQIAKRQEGGVRQYFFFDKLQESLISIPSLPEQRRIGAFFSALDNLIDAAEKRTKSLHTLKSAYLQRMFV